MRHRSHSLSAARMWICSRPAGVPRSMPVLELQFWKDGDDDPGPRWRARAGAAARQGLGRLAHAAGEEAAVSRLDLYRGAMRGDRDHQGEPHRSAPRVRSRRTRTRTSLVPNPIQDSRDLHPVVRLRGPGECRNHHSLRGDAGCLIRGAVRVEAARPVAAQNAAHRSLQNRRRFRTAPTRLILVFLSEERRRPEPSESLVTDPQILRRRHFSEVNRTITRADVSLRTDVFPQQIDAVGDAVRIVDDASSEREESFRLDITQYRGRRPPAPALLGEISDAPPTWVAIVPRGAAS